jgi:hypothetical protein
MNEHFENVAFVHVHVYSATLLAGCVLSLDHSLSYEYHFESQY